MENFYPLQEEAIQLAISIITEFQRKDIDVKVCLSSVCIMLETFCEMNVTEGYCTLEDIENLLKCIFKDIQDNL
jgi:hypothetical protein